jgi:hypothetical protein
LLAHPRLVEKQKPSRTRPKITVWAKMGGVLKLIEELASVHYTELSNRSEEMIKALKRLKR